MNKKRTLAEMNEQNKDKPFKESVYEIDGKLYAVTSHFVGEKNVDKVLFDIAFRKAFEESENSKLL